MNFALELYTGMSPESLSSLEGQYQKKLREVQSKLAMVRKAQKNQKRAAKKCDRLKTSA